MLNAGLLVQRLCRDMEGLALKYSAGLWQS